MNRSIPAIVGPTGVGKTGVALAMADQFGYELVSADSQQVYQGMDIGTGKEVGQGRWLDIDGRSALIISHVPIHGLNLTTPDKPFSVAQWADIVFDIIRDIQKRGRRPMLVGGTGFYLQALQGNITTLNIRPDMILREKLAKLTAPELFERLQTLNPAQAELLNESDRHNPVRLTRLIELQSQPKQPGSTKHQSPALSLDLIGLTMPRTELYRKVDTRVDQMVAAGLVDEVGQLMLQYSPDSPAFKAIGYRQIIQHLQGQITLDQAITQIKSQTHSYIRRQYTWFNKQPVHWVEGQEQVAKLLISLYN